MQTSGSSGGATSTDRPLGFPLQRAGLAELRACPAENISLRAAQGASFRSVSSTNGPHQIEKGEKPSHQVEQLRSPAPPESSFPGHGTRKDTLFPRLVFVSPSGLH